MKFEESFAELDRLLANESKDFVEMRRLLQEIWHTKEVFRWLDKAQDRLYASIASGHLKVLHNLEAGDIEGAKREAAAAIAWFHLRFNLTPPVMASQCPEIVETLRKIGDEAAQCPALRAALQKPSREIADQFSPGGESK